MLTSVGTTRPQSTIVCGIVFGCLRNVVTDCGREVERPPFMYQCIGVVGTGMVSITMKVRLVIIENGGIGIFIFAELAVFMISSKL